MVSSPWKPLIDLLTTFVHLFKQLSSSINTIGMYCSWRRWTVRPRDEPALVWNVHISPRTKAKHLVEILAEAGESVWLSTVKQGLSQEELLLQKEHRKKTLEFVDAHRGKELIFGDLFCDLRKLKLNFLAILTIITFGLQREKLASLRSPSQMTNMSIMLSGCFAAGGTGTLHKIDAEILKQHLKTSARK